jgi:hypothetical protein
MVMDDRSLYLSARTSIYDSVVDKAHIQERLKKEVKSLILRMDPEDIKHTDVEMLCIAYAVLHKTGMEITKNIAEMIADTYESMGVHPTNSSVRYVIIHCYVIRRYMEYRDI